MANYKRQHFMTFGPAIPIVPVGDFSKLPDGLLEGAWSIVGPSAQKNMARDFRGRCLELWQVIAAAYLEGLHHGSAMEKDNERSRIAADGVQQRPDTGAGRKIGRPDNRFNPDSP